MKSEYDGRSLYEYCVSLDKEEAIDTVERIIEGIGVLRWKELTNEYMVQICREQDLKPESILNSRYNMFNGVIVIGGLHGHGKTKYEALCDLCKKIDYLIEEKYNLIIKDYGYIEDDPAELYVYIYYIYFDYADKIFKKILIRKVDNLGNNLATDTTTNMYYTLSELIIDNLVYPYHVDGTKLITSYFVAKPVDCGHQHDFESVLTDIIHEPYAIYLTEGDKEYYSKQEIRIIEKVIEFMKSNYEPNDLKMSSNIEEDLTRIALIEGYKTWEM